MEFKSNIILSVIVHASIAVMTLAFAGRHIVLSHLPKSYIAVSLLGLSDEKNSLPENGTRNNPDRSKKPETKPQKALHKNEKKIAPSEMKDHLSGGNTLQEGRYPDKEIEQPLENTPGEAASLWSRPAGLEGGLGKTQPPPAAASSGEQAAGSTAGVTMIEMQSGSGGGNSQGQSLVGQIKASIERAKIYPSLARKMRQEGTVIAEFSINAKGLPQNIQIVKSSGFSLLDSATRDTILKASPFPVIKGTIEVPLTFILKRE